METERYSIIFSSSTGNTKELADTIYEVLPKEKCDYFGVCKEEPQSDKVYIGFWTNQGNADKETLELLKKLKNRKFSCLEQLGLVAVRSTFKKCLDRLKKTLIQATQLLVNICVRERCRNLCENAM